MGRPLYPESDIGGADWNVPSSAHKRTSCTATNGYQLRAPFVANVILTVRARESVRARLSQLQERLPTAAPGTAQPKTKVRKILDTTHAGSLSGCAPRKFLGEAMGWLTIRVRCRDTPTVLMHAPAALRSKPVFWSPAPLNRRHLG
jgi:hypothetical protein